MPAACQYPVRDQHPRRPRVSPHGPHVHGDAVHVYGDAVAALPCGGCVLIES